VDENIHLKKNKKNKNKSFTSLESSLSRTSKKGGALKRSDRLINEMFEFREREEEKEKERDQRVVVSTWSRGDDECDEETSSSEEEEDDDCDDVDQDDEEEEEEEDLIAQKNVLVQSKGGEMKRLSDVMTNSTATQMNHNRNQQKGILSADGGTPSKQQQNKNNAKKLQQEMTTNGNNNNKKKALNKRELREVPEDHRGKPVTYEIDSEDLFAKGFNKFEVLRDILKRKGEDEMASAVSQKHDLPPITTTTTTTMKKKKFLEDDEVIESCDLELVKDLVEDYAAFFISSFDDSRKQWASKFFKSNAKQRKNGIAKNMFEDLELPADLKNVFEKPAEYKDFIRANPKEENINEELLQQLKNQMPECKVKEQYYEGVYKKEREMMVPAYVIRSVSNVPEYRAYAYSVHENVRGLEEEKRRKLLITDQDGEYRVANEDNSDFSDDEQDQQDLEDRHPWHRRDDALLHSCFKYILGESKKIDDFILKDLSAHSSDAFFEDAEEENDDNDRKTILTGEEEDNKNNNGGDVLLKSSEDKENNNSTQQQTPSKQQANKKGLSAIDRRAKTIVATALNAVASYLTGVPPVQRVANRVKLLREQENGIRDMVQRVEEASQKAGEKISLFPKMKTFKNIMKEIISQRSIDPLPRKLHEFNNIETALDSFRSLFCPRCHTFSCQLHGNGHFPSKGRQVLTNYKPEWKVKYYGNKPPKYMKMKKAYNPIPSSRRFPDRLKQQNVDEEKADPVAVAPMDVDNNNINNNNKNYKNEENGGEDEDDGDGDDDNNNNNNDSEEDDKNGDETANHETLPAANYLALAKPQEPCKHSICWRSDVELFALVRKLQPPWLPPADRDFCAPTHTEMTGKKNSDISSMDISAAEMAGFVANDKSITDDYLMEISKRLRHSQDWDEWIKDAFDKTLEIFDDSANPCAMAGFLEPCKANPPTCKLICEEMLSIFCEDILEKRREDREEANNNVDGMETTTTDKKRKALRLIHRSWETSKSESRLNNKIRKKQQKKAFNVGFQGATAKTTVQRRKEASDGDKNALWTEYEPCNCEGGECTADCPCSNAMNFCEINCGCGAACKNAFIGCLCSGDCSKDSCPCKRAARECDPDKCANCWPTIRDFSRRKRELEGMDKSNEIFTFDPTLHGIVEVELKKNGSKKMSCVNMRLQLNQHAHILLGKSPIAGWGAFFGVDAKKNDFLGEYVGEMITHVEAERRGSQYDQTNSSYLFNLNDKWVLDAYSRGNKFKFANHSKKPNCYPLVMYVRGDHRIGIYAKGDSKFGDEMFYDYGYTKDIIGEARVWAHEEDEMYENRFGYRN
jgi:hypothetical protein